MKIRPLTVEGAFEITPVQHVDARGTFLEWYRFDALAAAVGHPLDLAQANLSASARGVVRGIHFADVPPGQAKYVTCVAGAVLDVVVDVRVGSPTFGAWEAVPLDDRDRRAIYLAEGLGHEHGIHPLDPRLGIAWPVADPELSPKDAAAPPLAEMLAAGRLPRYDACRDYVETLRRVDDRRSFQTDESK